MNNYDPLKHHRRSIRLKDYDYATTGFYYITLCTYNKQYLFGNISQHRMTPNSIGKMVFKWYKKLETKFENIRCHESVVMPNHFHFIIEIKSNDNRPESKYFYQHTDTSLSKIIQWLKTMTTNEYLRNIKKNNGKPFQPKLWQRNYWEHIILDNRRYDQIAEYINTNPTRWDDDKLNNISQE
jgi:putative transposase